MSAIYDKVPVLLFLVLFASSTAGAEQPQEHPPKPIEVSVVVDDQDGVYVGQTVSVRVVVRNTTAGPLMVLDWEKLSPSTRNLMVPLQVTAMDYPGQNKPRSIMGGGAGFFASTWSKDHYRALPPGETVIERSFAPMLPGRARIRASFRNSHNAFWESRTLREIKEVNWENGWVGSAFDTTAVSVADRLAAEDQERYAGYRRTLQDPSTFPEEKLKVLSEVVAERHYFAARFIRDAYEAFEPGPVKEAALEHLVDLAQFGTAYESFPLLVEVMADEKTPQEIRKTLIGWMGDVLARGGRQNLAGQAFHQYPEPLQQEARQAIKLLARDRNPLIAAKAREVLKRLPDEKEK